MKLIVISAGLAGAVGALAETARADTFIFSDDDFPDANWAIPDSVFMDPAQTGQRLAGGDPGAYRQIGLIFAERPDYAANLNLTFAYTPATQGAITSITYTFDLKATSAIGSSYYPLISQAGTLYYDPSAQAYNSENLWITYNLVLDLVNSCRSTAAPRAQISRLGPQSPSAIWRQRAALGSMSPSLASTTTPLGLPSHQRYRACRSLGPSLFSAPVC